MENTNKKKKKKQDDNRKYDASKPKAKVRYCRVCAKALPESRYFNHEGCFEQKGYDNHYDIHEHYGITN